MREGRDASYMNETGGTSARMGRVEPGERLALLAVILAGTALRLFRLGADSLWYDETVSTYLAGSPAAELLRHTAGDIHPPGYYLLLRGWLLLTGYPTGRADANGHGLELAAGFFSLFFGVLLIALVYALARRLAGRGVAFVAALLVALSPFNVWYGQEVRMYTLGAALGLAVLWALLEAVDATTRRPYVVYALAAAAGMYVLYYFAFLLIPLNLWALIALARRRRTLWPLILANLAAVVLYAPWLGTAYRQATQPPVPPWRTAPDVGAALLESWNALSFGQSAPPWIWPALLLTLALYVLGLRLLARRRTDAAVALAVATLGPLLLILVISLATPLYHVRYLFTYSPAFYIVVAGGLVALGRRSRWVAVAAGAILLIAAALSLRQFWFSPAFRADDHRSAVRQLEARWRPGDVVVVNAGWAYTALATYWQGEIAGRYRVTGALPEARPDSGLVIVTTGHTDGDPGLGWGDPRSDFFAMPAEAAKQQVADLFDRFGRVWHYRIYDTVNDPDGLVRSLLSRNGELLDERTYPGEAFLRVESYAPRDGAAWDAGAPGVRYGGLELRFQPPATTVPAGRALHTSADWLPSAPLTMTLGTSLRLVAPGGAVWAKAPDERPLGPLFTSEKWGPAVARRQPLALTVPEGTVPGDYDLVLVVYDANTGQPLAGQPLDGAQAADPGVVLGRVTVERPEGAPAQKPAQAEFGPLALIEAHTPVTELSPGGRIPVDLLWQARSDPAETLVVVVQALDADGVVAANIEEQPLSGRYPTAGWQPGELVRDRHTLPLPADLAPGRYRLIVGVYRAADGRRLTTRTGLLTQSPSWIIKDFDVR